VEVEGTITWILDPTRSRQMKASSPFRERIGSATPNWPIAVPNPQLVEGEDHRGLRT